MVNSLEVYRYAGTKAGRARNHNDEALARQMHEWLVRALTLETEALSPGRASAGGGCVLARGGSRPDAHHQHADGDGRLQGRPF